MKRIIILLLITVPFFSYGQFGVSFYQSNLPFVGLSYEFNNKLRPEVRLGTDNYFDAMSVEGVLTYDFFKKEDYDIYGGLGVRVNNYTGLVIPIGINIYPFTAKQFGFHIELAPIIGENAILRGSWGIRYKFRKKGE